jgi:two-component system, chemotaxis family, CheB/CheR fusion protein
MGEKKKKPTMKQRPSGRRERVDAQATPRAMGLDEARRTAQGRKRDQTGANQKTRGHKRAKEFPIVGMGASAGGLEAFEGFLGHMPAEDGMAFILVPHLDPSHPSMMTELLKRHTGMEVVEVKDGIKITPNRVYIISPNKDTVLRERIPRLTEPREPRGMRMPIDSFFRSLAEDQGERAICIILSGTGSDGTIGLRAIHGTGGMTMVQDPSTAKYEGMPMNAVATGVVDYVLPVEKMPDQLISFVHHGYPERVRKVADMAEKSPKTLERLFAILRKQTGHDFSLYKKSTIYRRIERRMALHDMKGIHAYVEYLEGNPLRT